MLDVVDTLDLWRNTVIVFTADHGMHIGEKGIWSKWTLYEEATHVPLIIYDPRTQYKSVKDGSSGEKEQESSNNGRYVNDMVELIDIFPTIVEMTQTGEKNLYTLGSDGDIDVSYGRDMDSANEGGKDSNDGDVRHKDHSRALLQDVQVDDQDQETKLRNLGKCNYRGEIHPGSHSDLLAEYAIATSQTRNKHEGYIGEKRQVYRHIYCDQLDGTSLYPYFTNQRERVEADRYQVRNEPNNGNPMEAKNLVRPVPFTLTQKLVCKSPNSFIKNPSSLLDLNSSGWIDHCPWKKIPRIPAYGAMAYSMRTLQYRYVAWLTFDTISLLPILDQPPIEEELYALEQEHGRVLLGEYHNLIRDIDSNGTFPQHHERNGHNKFNDENEAPHALHLHSLSMTRSTFRLALYDYLYNHSTFEHSFHARLPEHNIIKHIMRLTDYSSPNPSKHADSSGDGDTDGGDGDTDGGDGDGDGGFKDETGHRKRRGAQFKKKRKRKKGRSRGGHPSDKGLGTSEVLLNTLQSQRGYVKEEKEIAKIVLERYHERHPHWKLYSRHYYR